MKFRVLLASLLILGSSCKEEEPPQLPQVGSLYLDMKALEDAPAAVKQSPQVPGVLDPKHLNFANAWVRAKILQAAAGLVIVIPTLGMAAALSQEPVEQDGKWLWSVTGGGATIELEIGASAADGWEVEMYITNKDLDRFLWVDGNFELDVTNGEWRLHDHNIKTGSDEALAIQWTYVSDTDRALSYTIRSSASDDQDDEFEWSVDGTSAELKYTDADDSMRNASIVYDTATHVGSLDPAEGDTVCWDEMYENTDCP